MWMDVVVALIFVISTAVGFRQGFVHTFIHTAGWLLSIVLAFAWYAKVENFMRNKTNFYDTVYNKVAERVAEEGSSAGVSFTKDMPVILQEFIDSIKNSVADAIAMGVSDFLFKVICFLLLVIAIRLVFMLFSSLFSKKNNEGFLGFIDGVFGLLAGAIKGLLIIFLLLALLVPVIGLSSGDSLAATLESSRIAGIL
ncbi:MAG: CvpA family protein, partial [Clostridiales bacterium]|nr:CvpA family protein [Clostridiales bacterium]